VNEYKVLEEVLRFEVQCARSAMYKNSTAPDSGGSPPTSTNSDVATIDKESVPLDEAVGKLLEGTLSLADTRASNGEHKVPVLEMGRYTVPELLSVLGFHTGTYKCMRGELIPGRGK
jgi:hypothetical protein